MSSNNFSTNNNTNVSRKMTFSAFQNKLDEIRRRRSNNDDKIVQHDLIEGKTVDTLKSAVIEALVAKARAKTESLQKSSEFEESGGRQVHDHLGGVDRDDHKDVDESVSGDRQIASVNAAATEVGCERNSDFSQYSIEELCQSHDRDDNVVVQDDSDEERAVEILKRAVTDVLIEKDRTQSTNVVKSTDSVNDGDETLSSQSAHDRSENYTIFVNGGYREVMENGRRVMYSSIFGRREIDDSEDVDEEAGGISLMDIYLESKEAFDLIEKQKAEEEEELNNRLKSIVASSPNEDEGGIGSRVKNRFYDFMGGKNSDNENSDESSKNSVFDHVNSIRQSLPTMEDIQTVSSTGVRKCYDVAAKTSSDVVEVVSRNGGDRVVTSVSTSVKDLAAKAFSGVNAQSVRQSLPTVEDIKGMGSSGAKKCCDVVTKASDGVVTAVGRAGGDRVVTSVTASVRDLAKKAFYGEGARTTCVSSSEDNVSMSTDANVERECDSVAVSGDRADKYSLASGGIGASIQKSSCFWNKMYDLLLVATNVPWWFQSRQGVVDYSVFEAMPKSVVQSMLTDYGLHNVVDATQCRVGVPSSYEHGAFSSDLNNFGIAEYMGLGLSPVSGAIAGESVKLETYKAKCVRPYLEIQTALNGIDANRVLQGIASVQRQCVWAMTIKCQ